MDTKVYVLTQIFRLCGKEHENLAIAHEALNKADLA